MNFNNWKSKLKEAAQKAAEQLNFDEMARKDEYIHQEGLNVVRKERPMSSVSPNRQQKQHKQQQSSAVPSAVQANNTLPVLSSSSTTPSIASSTRSVASMRQHSSLGSMQSYSDDEPTREEQQPVYDNDEELEYTSRKNKLRFLQDLDHRLSKPNQELELPLYTKMNTSQTTTTTASPQKKQPLWAKPARPQASQVVKIPEDEAPLIVTTTSTAVLDDSELQALAALQQQSASSTWFVVPSCLRSWCSTRIPFVRQYPKMTGLLFILVLFYLLRIYSRLVIPVEQISDD